MGVNRPAYLAKVFFELLLILDVIVEEPDCTVKICELWVLNIKIVRN